MTTQTPCPKCGEVVTSVKEVRTSQKKGKPMSWFVNLVIGGIFLTISVLMLSGIFLAMARNDFSMIWVFILDFLIFFIPGLLLVLAYTRGTKSPFYKCAKCKHKWTQRQEELRLQKITQQNETLAQRVRCPKCAAENYSTHIYFLNPKNGDKIPSASNTTDSMGMGLFALFGGILLCALGLFFTGGIGLVSNALFIIIFLIFSGLGAIVSGIRIIIANRQHRGRERVIEHTCIVCKLIWKDGDIIAPASPEELASLPDNAPVKQPVTSDQQKPVPPISSPANDTACPRCHSLSTNIFVCNECGYIDKGKALIGMLLALGGLAIGAGGLLALFKGGDTSIWWEIIKTGLCGIPGLVIVLFAIKELSGQNKSTNWQERHVQDMVKLIGFFEQNPTATYDEAGIFSGRNSKWVGAMLSELEAQGKIERSDSHVAVIKK